MARRAAPRKAILIAAAFAALGVALGPAGCVLFVPDEELGTDCRFAGAGSACGECVAAHCQESVNACCASSACAATLRSLESCTTGDPAGCTDLATRGEPVALCVQAACTATCGTASAGDGAAKPDSATSDATMSGGDSAKSDSATSDSTTSGADSASTGADGGTQSDGSTPTEEGGMACALTSGTSTCICVASAQPNGPTCDGNTFGDPPNTVCYQDTSNGQCECDHMGCHMANAGFCTCELPDTHPALATCDQAGFTCCVAGFSECDCSDVPGGDCSPDPKVMTCTLSALEQQAPSNYVFVTSCSNP